MASQAVIQISKQERGWYIQACQGNEIWTEEGPFDSRQQATSAIAEYAALVGFTQYDITSDE